MIPIDDQILDAISTLLGLTPGDVYGKIQDEGFEKLAAQALKSFAKDLSLRRAEEKENTPPVDDRIILLNCLAETEVEIEILMESKLVDPISDIGKELRELEQDAADLRQRLNSGE